MKRLVLQACSSSTGASLPNPTKIEEKDDGIFWIAFEDFCRVFQTIYVCKLFSTDVWSQASVHGRWSIADNTAGGCSCVDNNPQFLLQLVTNRASNPTETTSTTATATVSVTVVLSQAEEPVHVTDPSTGQLPLQIPERTSSGIFVYTCKEGKAKSSYLRSVQQRIAESDVFTNTRDVSLEFTIEIPTSGVNSAGTNGAAPRIVIVPCLYYSNKENGFDLRVYANCGNVTLSPL
jgi:hypothetical protein